MAYALFCQDDESKAKGTHDEVSESDSDEIAMDDDDEAAIHASASMDSYTSEPKPIMSSRENVRANSAAEPLRLGASARANSGSMMHSRSQSLGSARVPRRTQEEKAELSHLQKSLSELLSRARLVIPKIRGTWSILCGWNMLLMLFCSDFSRQ